MPAWRIYPSFFVLFCFCRCCSRMCDLLDDPATYSSGPRKSGQGEQLGLSLGELRLASGECQVLIHASFLFLFFSPRLLFSTHHRPQSLAYVALAQPTQPQPRPLCDQQLGPRRNASCCQPSEKGKYDAIETMSIRRRLSPAFRCHYTASSTPGNRRLFEGSEL